MTALKKLNLCSKKSFESEFIPQIMTGYILSLVFTCVALSQKYPDRNIFKSEAKRMFIKETNLLGSIRKQLHWETQ